MAWDDLADLANVATRDHFGTPVTYTPRSTGQPQEIEAPFDRPFAQYDAEGQPVMATRPVLHVRLADLASPPKRGDRVVVKGENFRVKTVEPDGHGGADLELLEDAA